MDAAYYRWIENCFKLAVADLTAVLPKEVVAEVLGYIDHNEFGVAIECLIPFLVENRISISDAAYYNLLYLACKMGLTGSEAELIEYRSAIK